MVSYQKYTQIAFAVAESKGAQFESISDGGSFVSQLAEYWNQNKNELKQLTERQTKNKLQSVVEP